MSAISTVPSSIREALVPHERRWGLRAKLEVVATLAVTSLALALIVGYYLLRFWARRSRGTA